MIASGSLGINREDIGAMWFVYVAVLAQIHFVKARRGKAIRGLAFTSKVTLWAIVAVLLGFYTVIYGPGWTHGGMIVHPTALYLWVIGSLILPAVVLTFWLAPGHSSKSVAVSMGQNSRTS
jgi:hypothetical protein